MRLLLIITVLFFDYCYFVPNSAHGQVLSSDSSLGTNLTSELGLAIQQAQVSLVVQKLGEPGFRLSYAPDKKLMPASNLKILTTYLALKYLPDTLIGFYYKQKHDTLYLIPTGDPTLLHPSFLRAGLLHFFSKLGKQINYISLNTYAWRGEQFAKGWIFDDYPYYFMPENSIMPFYSNLISFRLTKRAGKQAKPSFTITPFLYSTTPLKIDLQQLRKLGRYYTVSRSPHQNYFFLKEDKNIFKAVSVPIITNNTEFSEKVLNKLTGKKILISTKLVKTDNSWSRYPSQRRDEVLYYMMTNSDNFVAEQLLLMISARELGYMQRDSIINYLYSKELSPLFNQDTAVWLDGSGLSVYNRFSARQLNTILAKTYMLSGGISHIAKLYGHANTGTLKDFFPNHTETLFAKTGSMRHTFCLSGFFRGQQSQQWHSFSFLINNIILPSTKIKRQIEKYLSEIIQRL